MNMRILLVDNYEVANSQPFQHLYNILTRIIDQPIESIHYSNLTPQTDVSGFNAIILSGSQKLLSEPGIFEEYANLAEIIRNTTRPLLGICFGHQLLSRTFGVDIVKMPEKLQGYYIIKVITPDPIFEGLGNEFLVTKSHQEMVSTVPYDFILLANSPTVPVEVIRHINRPVYGVQFHPERYDPKHPAGKKILENFISIAWLY